MPRLSRRTHLSIGLLLLSCMIIAMIFGGPLFGRFVFEELRDRVLAESGGKLFVESFSADFFKGRFQFTGFVYEEVRPGQRSFSLSAKEGTLDISIGSLFGSGSFIIEELRLVSPVVKYRQERAAGLTTSQGALRQGIYLKKLQLQDGQVWFDDLSGERPVHIELTSLQMSGEELSTHQPLQLCSHVNVSARLEGEPVGVQGSGMSSGWQDAGVGLAESCRFQGIPTAPLLPYLLEGLPIRATQGKLEGEVSMIPMGGGSIRTRSRLQFQDIKLDLGVGPVAFMAKSTGVPQAIEAKQGTFSFVVLRDFTQEETSGYVGDFLRKFLAVAWQQAIVTLTTTR
jgi:hypothetical protein